MGDNALMEKIMTMTEKKIVTTPTANDMEDADIVVERKQVHYGLMGRIMTTMGRQIVKTVTV
jgi:hypothetical protein